MANPGINGADKATNAINDRLTGILNEAATEQPAAEAVKDAATAPTTPATDEKNKYEYTDATSNLIGKINSQRIQNNAAIESSPLGVAMKEFGNKTRIVGYCCRLPEKIDFKRTVTVNKEAGTDATYSFGLNMTPPSKPDRVIVKYPLDLYAKIDNEKSNITTKDVTEMNALMDSEAAFAVKIFRVGKTDHTLFNWVNSHCINPFINEAEEIFVPYTRINSKGEAETRENYIGEAAYASTGEKPGLKITCTIASNKNAKKDVGGNVTKIDITKQDSSELKVTFSHTGRPRWCAPGNFIVDKKFATIPGEAPADTTRQIEMSKCYFRRWFSESLADGVKRSKNHIEAGIQYQATGSIKVNAVSEDQFTATPFTDSSFWATASVQHWYDTAQENGKIVRKTLTGADLKLVERISKTNANTGKTTYSNRTFPLTADGVPESAYTWSEAVPEKVKAAIGSAMESFTFDVYKKSMQKVASAPKASSRVSIDAGYLGLTFEEIQQRYQDALSSAGTTAKFQ